MKNSHTSGFVMSTSLQNVALSNCGHFRMAMIQNTMTGGWYITILQSWLNWVIDENSIQMNKPDVDNLGFQDRSEEEKFAVTGKK